MGDRKSKLLLLTIIIALLVLSGVVTADSGVVQQTRPTPNYIIEFKQEPVLENRSKALLKIRLREEAASHPSLANTARLKRQLKAELNDHKDRIIQEQNTFRLQHPQITPEKVYSSVINGMAVYLDNASFKSVLADPRVKRVHPNHEVNITLDVSVPLIGTNSVWQLDANGDDCTVSGQPCLRGEGVTIAILDTGVDYTHTDLGGCIGVGCKVIGGYDFISDDSDPMDDHGHGTHVAATAAGDGDLVGVAADSKIYAIKVLNSAGKGSFSQVISGIEWVVDPNGDGDFSDHVDILSMSLGLLCLSYGEDCGPNDIVSKAVDNAVAAGVVATISAGNNGPFAGTVGTPGTARRALTVGATDDSDALASFSSRGPIIWDGGSQSKPDLVAPGVLICAARWDNSYPNEDTSCYADNDHVALSGTSMSTPHAAGAAALLLQKHPDWSPAEIKQALKDSALDLGLSEDELGSGRLDVFAASQVTSAPDVVELHTHGRATGLIDIKGTAMSTTFESYLLRYGVGLDPQTWVDLQSSSTPIEEGVLHSDFDTSTFDEGVIALELEMSTTLGQKIVRDHITVDYVYFSWPRPGTFLNEFDGTEQIIGSVIGPGLLNYEILLYDGVDFHTTGITLAGTGPVVDGTLGWLDLATVASVFGPRTFTLYLRAHYAGGIVREDTISIGITSYQSGWPQQVYGRNFWSTPAIGDIDNNGDLEVVTPNGWSFVCNPTCGSHRTQINAWNHDGSTVAGWPKVHTAITQTSPALADIDDDGDLEIFTGDLKGKMHAWHHDGSDVVGWPYQTSYEYCGTTKNGKFYVNSPAIGDIDNDGDLEIVAGLWDVLWLTPAGCQGGNHVWAWHHDGTLVDGWPVSIPAPRVNTFVHTIATPSLADLDGNEDLEIVLGTHYYLHVLNHDGSYFDGDNDGTEDWPQDICINPLCEGSELPKSAGTAAIGDINKDGQLDIVVTSTANTWIGSRVHAFNVDGTELAGFPVGPFPDWTYFDEIRYGGRVALADIFLDGYLEIIVAIRNDLASNMLMIRHDGTIEWDIDEVSLVDLDGISYYGVGAVVADVDGDGDMEILVDGRDDDPFGVEYGRLFGWHHDGSQVAGFPQLLTAEATFATVSVTDLDQDGDIDFLGGMNDQDDVESVYVLDLTAPYDPDRIEWGQYAHDRCHSGQYKKPLSCQLVDLPADGSFDVVECGDIRYIQIECSEDTRFVVDSAAQFGSSKIMNRGALGNIQGYPQYSIYYSHDCMQHPQSTTDRFDIRATTGCELVNFEIDVEILDPNCPQGAVPNSPPTCDINDISLVLSHTDLTYSFEIAESGTHCSDPDGDPLTYRLHEPSSNGKLQYIKWHNHRGLIARYKHIPTTNDHFAVEVGDGHCGYAVINVDVTVV